MAIDYLAGNNWGTAGSWLSNSVPVDGDDVTLNEKLTGPVTGGLTQENVYLNTLAVHPACKHPIGTPTATLITSTKLLIMEGQADFNFTAEKTGGAGEDVLDCWIQAATPNVKIFLDSGGSTAAEYDQIVHNRGILTLGGGMLFGTATLYVGRVSADTDATVVIGASSSGDTLPGIVQTSGKITSNVIVTTATVSGGTYEQFDAAVTTVTVGTGGMFIYKNAVASTITTLTILPGGVADFTKGFSETTITNLWLHPGGTLIGSDQDGASPLEGTLIVTNPHKRGGMWKRTAA